MIKLPEPNRQTRASVTISKSKMITEIIPVFTTASIWIILKPVLFADMILLGSHYFFPNGFGGDLLTIFFVNVLMPVFGMIQFFQKTKFILQPYKRTAEIKEGWSDVYQTKWPLGSQLSYQTKYNESHKSLGIELFAKSPDGQKEIPLFIFGNEKSFETFLETYNESFPDLAIK